MNDDWRLSVSHLRNHLMKPFSDGLIGEKMTVTKRHTLNIYAIVTDIYALSQILSTLNLEKYQIIFKLYIYIYIYIYIYNKKISNM